MGLQTGMNIDVTDRFRVLNQWNRNGQRAPHKPLMLLIALGRYQNGIKKFTYEEIERELIELLVKYGPWRPKYKPDEPFWRLGRKEKIFDLKNSEKCPVHRDGGTSPTALKKYNVTASFDAEIDHYLQSHPEANVDIAVELINTHFQPSFVEDLMSEVGLSFASGMTVPGGRRDPEFRKKVLSAYEDRCAICQFHMVLDGRAVGLEAAHIKWHNAGGPDTEDNGLALCTLHHKLFDYGVFLVEPVTFRVKVSNVASCFNSALDYVKSFDNQKIHLPSDSGFYPAQQFLEWHEREKFKR